MVLNWQDLPTRMPRANNSQKLQRESRLRKHESVALVQDFVTCMNEISQILSIAKQTSGSIENLKFLPHFPNENYNPILKNQISYSDKVDNLLSTVNRQLGKLPDLLGDLKTSLDVVCHPNTNLR